MVGDPQVAPKPDDRGGGRRHRRQCEAPRRAAPGRAGDGLWHHVSVADASANPRRSSPPSGARKLITPVQQFMHTESSSGLVLALAALVAMVWVNVGASSYLDLWKTS